MLGSQFGGGGGVERVLMSKLCHCVLLDKSPRFLFSPALKVNLSKEHCNFAFVFGSLFFMLFKHIIWKLIFCISIVCIHRAGRGPWCWQLRAVQFVFEEVLHAFISLCDDVVQSGSSQFLKNDQVMIVAL